MLLATALLASVLVGPELTPPPEPTTPARGIGAAVVALSDNNFAAFWVDNSLIAAQAISGTPVRKTATILGSGIPNGGPYEVKAAAIGNRVLAAWSAFGHVSWAIVDERVQVLARGDVQAVASPYVRSIAVTAVGNRYFVGWLTLGDGGGVFIDTGGRMSPAFGIDSQFGYEIAAASDGSRVLLAIEDSRNVTTLMIDGNGKVTTGGLVTPGDHSVASISAAWDGGGYALAWLASNSDTTQWAHWLAWTDANGRPLAPPLQFSVAEYALPAVLAETRPGVTLFTLTGDHRNGYVRFGIGGRAIDDTVQLLPVAFELGAVTAAAFDGHRYYVVSAYTGLRGAATDLISSSTPVPLAFNRPEVFGAEVAVGDHQSFLGWGGSGDDARIVRLKEGAFSEETPVHRFDRLVTDGDAVAAVGATRAELVDENGTLAATIALPDHPTALYQGVKAATRLSDGRLFAAAAWETNNIIDLWATTFDHTHVIDHGLFVPDIARSSPRAISVSGPSGVVAWVDDRSRGWIARFDTAGIRLGNAIPLDYGQTIAAMAVDDNGHALVLTYPSFANIPTLLLVDLTTMTIARKTRVQWPYSEQIAWTGEEYIIASRQLDLMRVSPDGAPLDSTRLDVPYPPFNVRLASGAAGTVLVYCRLAPDIGAGTVYRPFVRLLHAPRRRAALK